MKPSVPSHIQLLTPLTKESVSTNHHKGHNWYCNSPSTIQTVDAFAAPWVFLLWLECTSASVLSVGMAVRARFINPSGRMLQNYFPGTINRLNNSNDDDGGDQNETATTFDIVYDDGDTRKNVPLNEIQMLKQ